jgi:DNA gyrase/topoisomerase IV subunit A
MFQNRIEKYSPDGKLIWRADRELNYPSGALAKGKIEVKSSRVGLQEPRMNWCSAAGVRGMSLAKKDEVIGMVSIGEAEKYVFTASEKGYGKRTEVASYRKTHQDGLTLEF